MFPHFTTFPSSQLCYTYSLPKESIMWETVPLLHIRHLEKNREGRSKRCYNDGLRNLTWPKDDSCHQTPSFQRSCRGLAVLLSVTAVLPPIGRTTLQREVAPASLEFEQLLPRWGQSGAGGQLQEAPGVFGTVGRKKWKWKSPLVLVTCSGHLYRSCVWLKNWIWWESDPASKHTVGPL